MLDFSPVLAFLLAVGAPGASVAPAPDTVVVLRGTVRADGYRPDGLLPGSLVEVRQGRRVRTGVADAQGRYRITGLAGGTARVAFSHVAAVPRELEVTLPGGGDMVVDVELERRTIPLPAVTVRPLPDPVQAEALRSPGDRRRVRLALRALEATSGMAESGLAAVASRGLSQGEAGAPERALFMRGSTVDVRRVFLDGAPVLTPFHVAGLVPPFDDELLGDADLYLGGAPSRYEGGLSYLLDVDTRSPRRDRTRFQVGADGLVLRSVLETPLPLEGSLLAGGRLLHGVQGTAGEAGSFPYSYGDLLARAGLRLGADHALTLTGFGNREGVRLELDPAARDPGAGEEAHWGNRVVSGRYRGEWDPVGVQATAAVSRYASALPVDWDDPVLARAAQERRRLGVDLELPAASGTLGFGASVERMELAYRLEPRSVQLFTSISPVREELSLTTTAGYAEWEGDVLDGVRVRGGLRAEHASPLAGVRLAPRAGVRFLLGESANLHLSAGRYHQVVPAPGLRGEIRAEEAEEPDVLIWDPNLVLATASHLVVGLDQEMGPDLRLELAGFAKGFQGLGLGGGGRSHASGVELRVARDGERFAGWLGYALSWFWTREGSAAAARFDGRHLLSAGMRAVPMEALEVGATLGYGAGLPFSAVTLEGVATADSERGPFPATRTLSSRSEGALNAGGGVAPLELAPPGDFLRLDLEVSWLLEPVVGGRTTRLRPYLKALNALNRRDALFYYFDRWREDEVRPLTRRPFLPLLGLEWRF